jgi:hypothetical protein
MIGSRGRQRNLKIMTHEHVPHTRNASEYNWAFGLGGALNVEVLNNVWASYCFFRRSELTGEGL